MTESSQYLVHQNEELPLIERMAKVEANLNYLKDKLDSSEAHLEAITNFIAVFNRMRYNQ